MMDVSDMGWLSMKSRLSVHSSWCNSPLQVWAAEGGAWLNLDNFVTTI